MTSRIFSSNAASLQAVFGPRRCRTRSGCAAILADNKSWNAPSPIARDTHHAVTSSREGRSGAAHGFGLRQTKGRPASRRWISLAATRCSCSDRPPAIQPRVLRVDIDSRASGLSRRPPGTDPASRTARRGHTQFTRKCSKSPLAAAAAPLQTALADHRPRPSRRSREPLRCSGPPGLPKLIFPCQRHLLVISDSFHHNRCPRKS